MEQNDFQPQEVDMTGRIALETAHAQARKDFFANHEGDRRMADGEWVNDQLDRIAIAYQHKTREEVEHLKSNWLEDGSWDIENTPGYEEYKAELLNYRLRVALDEKNKEAARILAKMGQLGCSERMVRYTEKLEARLARMEERLEHTEDGFDGINFNNRVQEILRRSQQ